MAFITPKQERKATVFKQSIIDSRGKAKPTEVYFLQLSDPTSIIQIGNQQGSSKHGIKVF